MPNLFSIDFIGYFMALLRAAVAKSGKIKAPWVKTKRDVSLGVAV